MGDSVYLQVAALDIFFTDQSHATDMAAHIQAAEVDKSACVVVTERRNGIAFPVLLSSSACE